MREKPLDFLSDGCYTVSKVFSLIVWSQTVGVYVKG